MEQHLVDQVAQLVSREVKEISQDLLKYSHESFQNLLQNISVLKEALISKIDSQDQLISDLRQQIAEQTLIVSHLRSQINEREESRDQLGTDLRQAAQREYRTQAAQRDDSNDEMQTEAPVNQEPVLPQIESDTEETMSEPTPIPGNDVTESGLSTPEIARIRRFMKRYQDDEYLRTIIVSGMGPFDPESIQSSGIWAYTKSRLRGFGVAEILPGACKVVAFKSGFFKITYRTKLLAERAIEDCRRALSWKRKDASQWQDQDDRESCYADLAKFKFARLIPPRFDKKRKALSTIANQLKQNGTINWFEIFVVRGSLLLKTRRSDPRARRNGAAVRVDPTYKGTKFWTLGEDGQLRKDEYRKNVFRQSEYADDYE